MEGNKWLIWEWKDLQQSWKGSIKSEPQDFPGSPVLKTLSFPASGNLLYDAESSSQVLCDNLEEWDGVGGRREVQEGGDTRVPMTDSCWCMAEINIIL